MRIAWRTVGAIITRVWADVDALHDRFAGLARIGIGEISYKRGHKYLTVVVDHDTGRLVWAAPGRDKATLASFFDALGPERCAQITHVSADGADWIAAVVADRCPNAVRCADPFHVVSWATDALDEVRRQAWNTARGAVNQRRAGRASGHAKALKGARYALWKNPESDHSTTGETGLGVDRTLRPCPGGKVNVHSVRPGLRCGIGRRGGSVSAVVAVLPGENEAAYGEDGQGGDGEDERP
jgi:transposase